MDNLSVVRVYRNLHDKCLSVQEKVNGEWRVRGHVDQITLVNVLFEVSQAGRERCLKEGRKNVHAFIVGQRPTTWDYTGGQLSVVNYNPYKYPNFVREDGTVIYSAKAATVTINGALVEE